MTNKHVTNNHMGSGIVKFSTNTQLHNTFTSEGSIVPKQSPGLGNSLTNGEAATLYSQAATMKNGTMGGLVGSSPDNHTIPLRDSGTEVLRVSDLITNGS